MCSQGWLETILMVLALMNMLLLAVFLAACTGRVLVGGTGRVIQTRAERRARRHAEVSAEETVAEARVGHIDLGEDQ